MRKSLASISILAALLFSVSCGDDRTSHSLPTGPLPSRSVSGGAGINAPVPGTCTTQSALGEEINAVFAPGASRGQVHGDVGKLNSDINKHDIAAAQALAFSITNFTLQQLKANQVAGMPGQVKKLVNDVFCYAGLSSTITDPASTTVVYPSSTTQIVTNNTGTAGASFPPNSVTEPTVIEFVLIPDTFGGNGAGPLHTKLDQYSGFFFISNQSASGAPFALPVTVGICPDPTMNQTVRMRLNLGHDAIAGFEITPPAPANFLTCPVSVGAAPSRMPGWLKTLASLVLPKPLYARMPFFATGGVGGSATEFSPFAPVDPLLSFTGGVGGSATEFKRSPAPGGLGPLAPKSTPKSTASFLLAPGSRFSTIVGGVCSAPVEGVLGEPLDPACRPLVTLTTHLGTVLTGVPVSWLVTSGGGSIASETVSSLSCVGEFASTANDITDVNGKAGVCWTLGPNLGSNTVIATPHVGGDAPAGVAFDPVSETFTATALQATPGFSDGFEVESGWTATGFWNRSTLLNIVNVLFPNYVDLAPGDGSLGALPAPFAGSYAFWYGNAATGNYLGAQNSSDYFGSGGTSAAPNSGTLTSPPFTLPVADGQSIVLRFNTWWDIESVNPSTFDIMQVSIEDETGAITPLGVLNPSSDPAFLLESTPFTSGGFNKPPVWVEVAQDVTAFSGRTVRLIYSFDTIDILYNGFRGWVIDNVRVGAEVHSLVAPSRRPAQQGFGPASQQVAPPTVTLQPVPPPQQGRRMRPRQ